MIRVPVRSSHLVSVGYDEEEGVLEVEFRNGWVYQYAGVPFEVYDELLFAVSPGEYLQKSVIPRFSWERIGH